MGAFGASKLVLSDYKVSDLKVALVVAGWHVDIAQALLEGALRALDEGGVVFRKTVWVPGSFELPVVSASLVDDFDVVVALGVVVRGGTAHFEYVCQAATSGLLDVSLRSGVPVGFGVLTCDDLAQAYDRAGLVNSREDKGYEAACAALITAEVLRSSKGD